MILVTGATGSIGSEVARLLAERGVAARAFHRRHEDSARFTGMGLESAVGSFEDADETAAAMEGCDRVFLLPPPTPHQERFETTAIEAARRVGVRRIVKVSAEDANLASSVPWAKSHAAGEDKLRGSGLGYTILRPSAFFQNFLEIGGPIGRGVLPIAAGRGLVGFIDARDVAAVAVSVLLGDGHERATYFLTGPEALCMREVAACFSEALGRKVRYVDLPVPLYRLALRAAGLGRWTSDALVSQFADVVAGGHCIAMTDEVERLTGRAPRPIRAFAAEHGDVFGRVKPK